jgi:CRISPR system Cascade subunit CasD
VIRDFQTAASLDSERRRVLPLTHRYYLSDAAFVAAVEGTPALIDNLADALLHPRFPLYFGRRSCPPADRVFLSTRAAPMPNVLAEPDKPEGAPWVAASWWRERQPHQVRLDIIRDAEPAETPHEVVRDLPLSFDPDHRQYSLRAVVHDHCWVVNRPKPTSATAGRNGQKPLMTNHDPYQMWGDD